MNILVHSCLLITLAVLLQTADTQNPAPLQFQTSPVLVATGSNAIFSLQTITETFSVAWIAPGGSTLGQWVGGQAVLNSVSQYQGRVTITATQLTISSTQLSDAGNYTATVVPIATTGLTTNSLSVALKVYDAVSQVSVVAPSLVIEGGNVSVRCSWGKGSGVSVVWALGSTGLVSNSHVTVSAGSVIISPVSRSDAGVYSCTVSNPISAQTASATLTVYYGPDTPQVTKTSAQCVGGGDATVGQTVKLTCTSVSLPPALLSWKYGGSVLTVSSTTGGSLDLTVFSTNQSGEYTCTALNSITTGSSQQQLNLSVVGTCLSVGAVAGIVVACFVALVLIIIAIVLLLRQRKVDRRLREVAGHQKTNPNNRPPDLPAPQNGLLSAVVANGNQANPPLHNSSRPPNLPKSEEPTVWHTGQEENNSQNRLNNTNLNTATLPNNGNRDSSTLPNNGHQNGNSNPNNGLHNSSVFPQSRQQNPNILIQTGNGEPGGQTVLINLNPMLQTEVCNSTSQPQTVQVSLNPVPQTTPGNQTSNQNVAMFNDQQNVMAVPQRLANGSQQNLLLQTGGATQTDLNTFGTLNSTSAANRLNQAVNPAVNQAVNPAVNQAVNQAPNVLVPTGYNSHPTTHSRTGRQTRTTHRSSERRNRRSNTNRTRSRSSDSTTSSSPHLRQMPWDRLRGTPAYPNHQTDSSDSYESRHSTERDRTSRADPNLGRSTQVPRERSPLVGLPDGQVWTVSETPRRNFQREAANSPSRVDPNVQRQDLHDVHQNWTALPQSVPQNVQVPHATSVPQNQAIEGHRTQLPPLTTPQTRPQKANLPHPLPLTEAALQLHTTHTPNPFSSRIQQTQAALQNPGPASRPTEAQTTQAGQRPPTPPAVLRPAEFQTLPRERLQQPQTLQPVQVMRQPHGTHRHQRANHVSPQRHPGNQHMHPTALRHGNMPPQRQHPHTSQVHRSRHRF
ncbi:hypothetical protein AMEX_G2575 [Astyanax mexicanus]|uniref:Ig-like domain-containing protein n=1 Tax=Astyanax mexicanus TaxID=7994 RepID=A0A8T2MT63_ASTMX|nr:hypothetical protein AMEX_G2575 [Astyanax mexicanus]